MVSGAYDVIAVGSGHNGLVAAAYLACANRRVLVLESQPFFGGGVASGELTAQGFIHERHGTLHAKIMANPLITADELRLQGRYGLGYIRPADSYGVIFEDGSWLGLSHDRERTLASIAAVASEDVEAYRRFAQFSNDLVKDLIPGFFSPPTMLGSVITGLESSRQGRRLERMMLMSACDVIREHFTSDRLRVALTRLVAELLILHPDEKGTGLFAAVAVGYLDRFGYALPRGGGSALTEALIKCIQEHGGEVVGSTTVDHVMIQDGRAVGVQTTDGRVFRARDAILGAIHPHDLGDRVPGLAPDLIDDARAVELSHYTGFVVQGALDAPLRFRNAQANDCALVTVGATGFDSTLRAFDALKRGQLTDPPLLWSTTMPDPTRAPEGAGVLHCYCMTVYDVANSGPHMWTEQKEQYSELIVRRLQLFTEPLRFRKDSAHRVLTPLDHELNSPSFARGDLNGAGMFLHQNGGLRPTAALGQFAVPGAAGLYLVGPFMHPGGGITGGGRATAIKIFDDLGINFDDVISPPRPPGGPI